MAPPSMPRMSLVAQFDDLCRYTNVLTSGPEEEFRIFAEGQLNCMRKWKGSELEVAKLKEKISNLKTENGRLETKIKHLKDLLKDADDARRKVEYEKNSLARQISIIKEVLLADGGIDNQTREKLFFLSTTGKPGNSPPRLHTIEESAGSLLSLSEIDQTDEDLESRSRRGRKSRGKRSSSESRAAQKKKRLDEEEQFRNRENDYKNTNYADVDQRSSSEPASSSPDFPSVPHQDHRSNTTPFKYNTYDKYDTASLYSNTPISYNTVKQVGKNHQFVTKTVMNRVKCVACKQNINYLNKSLKCHTCGIIYHPECVKQCSVICFPIVNTPTKGTAGTVADYTSSSSPMIPPLIVHCVREIESRGLRDIGLYRVSGSERDVKSLKDKFVSGRPIPSLSDVDINVLCGVVKDFLRSLKEPLITRSAWQSFVDAADLRDDTESSYALCGLIMDLPQPNRDTLSFLVLHLIKIAESPQCKMDVHNLATVFGPTVVGYSSADPADGKMLTETTKQHQVMKRLLSLPKDFWQNALSVECENFHGSVKGTPENLPAPRTRLGPIYASAQKTRSQTLRKATLTPRNSKSSKQPMHFASPLLK